MDLKEFSTEISNTTNDIEYLTAQLIESNKFVSEAKKELKASKKWLESAESENKGYKTQLKELNLKFKELCKIGSEIVKL